MNRLTCRWRTRACRRLTDMPVAGFGITAVADRLGAINDRIDRFILPNGSIDGRGLSTEATVMSLKVVSLAEPSNRQWFGIVVVMPLGISGPTNFTGLANQLPASDGPGESSMGSSFFRVSILVRALDLRRGHSALPIRIVLT